METTIVIFGMMKMTDELDKLIALLTPLIKQKLDDWDTDFLAGLIVRILMDLGLTSKARFGKKKRIQQLKDMMFT